MKMIKKSLIANVLGTTKSGKYIFNEPEKNTGFKKQDHLDAYTAHASFLMKNILVQTAIDKHLMAMNQHYLSAVNAE